MDNLATRRIFSVAAIALRYPEREWLKTFEELEFELDKFEESEREIIWDLQTYFSGKTLLELQTSYVDLFDRKRRACLYLSYYLNGDTRRRGMALLEFKQRYAFEGWKGNGDELDDFLPMLLEFIAVTASPLGFELLQEHKPGVALLEKALRDMKSPYAGIIKAILLRIPGDQSRRTLQLIESGPPVETVGLAPYGIGSAEKFTAKVGEPC